MGKEAPCLFHLPLFLKCVAKRPQTDGAIKQGVLLKRENKGDEHGFKHDLNGARHVNNYRPLLGDHVSPSV